MWTAFLRRLDEKEGRFGQKLEEDMEAFILGNIRGLSRFLGRGEAASGLEEMTIQERTA